MVGVAWTGDRAYSGVDARLGGRDSSSTGEPGGVKDLSDIFSGGCFVE